jgi:hypothetical protein
MFHWSDSGALFYDGDVPENPEEAWEITIAKWQSIVTLLRAGRPCYNSGGCDTCGLCMYYGARVDWKMDCEQCPLSIAGYDRCDRTPYQSFVYATLKDDWLGALQHAIDEIELLKAVRDENR